MKKHMLFIICTEFFLLFVLSDIKCMAAFPEEAQAAEETGALEGIPEEERTARFVCAVAAAFPDGSVETVRGTIEGSIAQEMLGENGFGYDPIFYVPEYGCTTAQMDPDKKNELSHRGNALRAMRRIIEERFGKEEE